MAFDLDRIRTEIQASPLLSPFPVELAVAIVNDCFRTAMTSPIPDDWWAELLRAKNPLLPEQVSMLGYMLSVSSLRSETIPLLPAARDPGKAIGEFFDKVAPLTAEMIRANRFRQEEFLRRWAETWHGAIQGETATVAAKRVEQLDYRRTMREFATAEAARKAEAERRAALLREAAEREAAARGWRE